MAPVALWDVVGVDGPGRLAGLLSLLGSLLWKALLQAVGVLTLEQQQGIRL